MLGLNIPAAQAALAQCTNSQSIAKWWRAQHQQLTASQAPSSTLLAQHSLLLDNLLEAVIGPSVTSHHLVLALGRYGQQQLLPYAPAAILLLGQWPESVQRSLHQQLHSIEPRLQCRIFTLQEWQALIAEDFTLYTSTLDARLVIGNTKLWPSVQTQLPHWPTQNLFTALEGKYLLNRLFTTAPNLHTITGGLRYFDALRWLAINSQHHAQTVAPLSAEQQQQLNSHLQTLLQTGWHLQCHTQGYSLLLTTRAQAAVTQALRQQQPGAHLTTPMLLQKLYVQALQTTQLCRIQLQRYRERLQADSSTRLRLINRRFVLRHHYLDTTDNDVIARWPFAMVEMFVIQGEEPNVERFSSRILAQCVQHKTALHTPTPAQQYWFLRLFDRSQHLFSQLLFMHQLGLLEQQIPEISSIKGAAINEPEQLYPRDLHALATVRELQQLRQADYRQHSPLAYSISYNLPRPALVYIAGLFHKLMPTPVRSAMAATAFCQRYGLASWEKALILWLVENYTLMLNTAEQQDTADPRTIYVFARAVGNLLRLDYLYLLTIAAVRASHPTLWNGWRNRRLEALYHACKRALRRGVHNPVVKADWANETRAQAAQLMLDEPVSQLAVQRLWTQIGDEYFLRESPADIAWHTKAILQHGDSLAPLVLMREQLSNTQQRGTQLFIYTSDSANLFAVTVSALGSMGLAVIDANIITSAHGFSLDTYLLLNEEGAALQAHEQQQVQQQLTQLLSKPSTFSQHLTPKPLHPPVAFTAPTYVQLANSADGFYTVVAIQTQDQPSLLAHIARVFAQFSYNIHHARITTYGERVEDTFHISDQDGLPLSEASQGFALQNALLNALTTS